MTGKEQESIISILQSFKNVSPFAATKLAFLLGGRENDRPCDENITGDSLLSTQSDQSVKIDVPPAFPLKPQVNLEAPIGAKIALNQNKKTPSFTETSKASSETIYCSKWISKTSSWDTSLSDSSCSIKEQHDFSQKQLDEYTSTSTVGSCDKSGNIDARLMEKQAKVGYYPSKSGNSSLKNLESRTTDLKVPRKRKEEGESNSKANSRIYQARDKVHLNFPKNESVTAEEHFLPKSYTQILTVKSEKDEQCQAMSFNQLAKTEIENADGRGEVDGLQISFKDSVEVLISVEEEHNESTTSDLRNKFTTSSSALLRASSIEESNNTWPKALFHVGEKPSPYTSDQSILSTNKSGKRKKPNLQCEETGCSYKARSRGELQQHMRKHTGERPILCEWKSCSKKFKDKSTYRVHYKSVHLKRKDYKCLVPGCGKSFGCAKSRNRHSTNVNLHQSIMTNGDKMEV